MMEMATTTAPTVAPTELTLKQEVDIESRTWAGINKPGGHAIVTKIYVDDNGIPNKVDVHYPVGGNERGVELTYVKMYVELERRGRSRRSATKINLGVLGSAAAGKKRAKKRVGGAGGKKTKGQAKKEGKSNLKKRKALASIDKNQSPTKSAKTEGVKEIRVETSQNAAVEHVGADGKWTLIQDGRIVDHIPNLQKGQRIAYWWSTEDGWLKGTIAKALSKVVTASIIKWTVKVDFDNGDNHTLNFHPSEKRWKICASNKKEPRAEKAKDDMSATTVKKPASKKPASKPIAEEKDGKAKTEKRAKPLHKTGDKDKAVQDKAKSAKVKSKGIKQVKTPTLSFGSNLQSKIKEISSRMHKTSSQATASGSSGGFEGCSPNSARAVKAAHAKSPMASGTNICTETIGFSEPFLPNTLSTAGKKTLPYALSQVSLVSSKHSSASTRSLNGKAVAGKSQDSSNYAKSLNSNEGPQSVLQNVYRNETKKAEAFVDFMTNSPIKTNGKAQSDVASSPGSEDSGLELEMDNGRIQLFNSTLSEIMFRKRLETLDVEEMIEKINTAHHSSSKPFTHLEIQPYLQKLHDTGLIFMVEDEGKMGVVYAI